MVAIPTFAAEFTDTNGITWSYTVTDANSTPIKIAPANATLGDGVSEVTAT